MWRRTGRSTRPRLLQEAEEARKTCAQAIIRRCATLLLFFKKILRSSRAFFDFYFCRALFFAGLFFCKDLFLLALLSVLMFLFFFLLLLSSCSLFPLPVPFAFFFYFFSTVTVLVELVPFLVRLCLVLCSLFLQLLLFYRFVCCCASINCEPNMTCIFTGTLRRTHTFSFKRVTIHKYTCGCSGELLLSFKCPEMFPSNYDVLCNEVNVRN